MAVIYRRVQMRNVGKTVQVTMLLLVFVLPVQAETIVFETNYTLSSEDIYDTVVVKGEGTVVNVAGGVVNTLIVMDSAVCKIIGAEYVGRIICYDLSSVNIFDDDPNNDYWASCYQQSSVNISSGCIVVVDAFDAADIEVSACAEYEFWLMGRNRVTVAGCEQGRINARNSCGIINIYGGENNSLDLQDTRGRSANTVNILDGTNSVRIGFHESVRARAVINITGGSNTVFFEAGSSAGEFLMDIYGGRNSLSADSAGRNMVGQTYCISGGAVDLETYLEKYEPAPTINISGGEIGHWYLDRRGASPRPKINVFGYTLNVVPYGGESGFGEISGRWLDGTAFVIPLDKEGSSGITYGSVRLREGVTPPDCSKQVFSDVDGDGIVNFQDFARMASEWLEGSPCLDGACSQW
jgi:hypothetical protein